MLQTLQPQQNIKRRNVLHFKATAFITWPAGAIVQILSDLPHSTSKKSALSSISLGRDNVEVLLLQVCNFITGIQKVL